MRQKFKINRPKKSLGQSFLKDNRIIEKITDSCCLSSGDTVLEIGPGHGELTERLVEKAGRVVAVEIDAALCRILEEKFAIFKNLQIICKDFLKFDFDTCFHDFSGKIKVIGNIPYYISSPIIERLLGRADKIDTVFLTVQKEFARRLVSEPGSKEYGSFSLFTQYYTEPKLLFYIKKGSFKPAPKVDSAFIRLRIRQEPAVKLDNEELFFKIIRAAFSQRRKKITNGLKGIVAAQALESFFLRYGFNRMVRPENLSLQDFANLTNCTSDF